MPMGVSRSCIDRAESQRRNKNCLLESVLHGLHYLERIIHNGYFGICQMQEVPSLVVSWLTVLNATPVAATVDSMYRGTMYADFSQIVRIV